MTTPSRRPGLVMVIALVAALASGCGDQAAQPQPRTDPAVYPAVTVDQAGDIVEAVDEAYGRASKGRDLKLAAGRVSGPAAALLAVRSTMDARLRRPTAEPPAARLTRLVVPAGSAWPRRLLAVTEVGGVSTPVIRVLVSPDARRPYALWAQPQMLPGSTVPATAGAEGTRVLPTSATGLAMTPADAMSAYAALLTAEGSGKASPQASRFAPDALRTQTAASSATERKATAGQGSVATAHTVVPTSTFALATTDGGAIVIGEIKQQTVITIKKGAQVRVTGDVSALVPNTVFRGRLVRTTTEVVVLKVPRAGAGTAVVSLIAADRGDVAIAGA